MPKLDTAESGRAPIQCRRNLATSRAHFR